MLEGIAYMDKDGGEERWWQYLTWHKLVAVPVSSAVINHTIKRLEERYKDNRMGDDVPQAEYLAEGVHMQIVLNGTGKDHILVFRSDSKDKLIDMVKSFHLSLPQQPLQNCENL